MMHRKAPAVVNNTAWDWHAAEYDQGFIVYMLVWWPFEPFEPATAKHRTDHPADPRNQRVHATLAARAAPSRALRKSASRHRSQDEGQAHRRTFLGQLEAMGAAARLRGNSKVWQRPPFR